MGLTEGKGELLARCIVCRGDIHAADPYEEWEGGYYCERHSLPHLRQRARLYADLLRRGLTVESEESNLS
ncbi:MAG TPA: hypothetical protein VKX16_18465 [Chloroflexota bacterium]|nr:hypothetical protein [Chloroflexota bacterium]